jgi:hypothetical protein
MTRLSRAAHAALGFEEVETLVVSASRFEKQPPSPEEKGALGSLTPLR